MARMAFTCLTLFGVWVGLSVQVEAQGFQVTPLVVPGCMETQATGINDKQQIVITCVDASGTQHSGLWRTDWFDPIEIEGAVLIWPSKTNYKRRTVGNYWLGEVDVPAFKTQGEQVFIVESPGADHTEAHGINDSDEIVGWHLAHHGPTRGFFRTLDRATKTYTFHAVLPPGATWATAYDVNNSQVAVGTFTDDLHVEHGFIYNHKAKTYRQIDVPGATKTHIRGVNDKGYYTGYYWDEVRWRGYVYNGSHYITFDAPESGGTFPMDINNLGQIVGFSLTPELDAYESFRAAPSSTTVAHR